jgi:hypothetical protein
MMIYCFDTSALNHLHDDPEAANLTTGLLATNTVWITALNVIEVGITEDAERRNSLLQLQRKLTDNKKPLQIANRLIRERAAAYAAGLDRAVSSVSEEDGVWIALNNPQLVNEVLRQELYRWKKELEDDFCQAHEKARPDFQQLFDSGVERPRTAASLLRHYSRSEDFLFELTSGIYEEVTGVKLRREELSQFFQAVPQWAFFCLGWAYAVYARAIRLEKFGRKNAGNIDLWCAAYLPSCDVFITEDFNQYKALRLINTFNQRRTEVLLYSRLRQRLLIG